MNGDDCVAAETAQQLSKVHCIVHKDSTLWADEVDHENGDAVENDDKDDYLVDDAMYYVNSRDGQ